MYNEWLDMWTRCISFFLFRFSSLFSLFYFFSFLCSAEFHVLVACIRRFTLLASTHTNSTLIGRKFVFRVLNAKQQHRKYSELHHYSIHRKKYTHSIYLLEYKISIQLSFIKFVCIALIVLTLIQSCARVLLLSAKTLFQLLACKRYENCA